MKFIKGLLIVLIIIIALAGVTIIGGYIYIRSNYNIDLFNTIGQLKTLSSEVDESKLCSNAFNDDDMKSVKSKMDNYIKDLISYDSNKGYEVNIPPQTPPTSFSDDFILSSKEAGALSQTIFYNQTGGKINISGKELLVNILQMDFINITSEGNCDVNIIAKVDLKSFKDDMNSLPFSLFKKYVPDYLYISSTVKVEKKGTNMDYEVKHEELKINNLTKENTDDLFHTLDVVLKIGSSENLNMLIGNKVVDALIGNKNNVGFAYSMIHYSKTSFIFKNIDNVSYIIIYE